MLILYFLCWQYEIFLFIMCFSLALWGRGKMAANFLKTLSNAFLEWRYINVDLNFIKFVHKGPTNNIPGPVQIMTWGRPAASFTKEVNPRLAESPLKTNGRLGNRGLTSLVKGATGDKLLSEPMMVSLLTRIFVTRSQWVKTILFNVALIIVIILPLHSNTIIYWKWKSNA